MTHSCSSKYYRHLLNQSAFSPKVLQEEAHRHVLQISKSLPLFQYIRQEADIVEFEPLAMQWRDTMKDVVILGTGGSSLGTAALNRWVEGIQRLSSERPCCPRLHVVESIEEAALSQFCEFPPETTAFLAISKSGNTPETVAQLLYFLKNPRLSQANYAIITEETPTTAMKELAGIYNIPCLAHPKDVGGRYAFFTIVSLFPAILIGCDPRKIRAAAVQVLDHALETEESPCIIGASLAVTNMTEGKSQTVLMPYVDHLDVFARWFRQLWAESLGKSGRGSTPIHAQGPVDQHSQLQLYLDGPMDKLFTVIALDDDGSPNTLFDTETFTNSTLRTLHKQSLQSLLAAEHLATIETLSRHHIPVRSFMIKEGVPEALGALMMHYIIETIATAHLIKVNPYDQPAVEESKILTRHYLENAALGSVKK